MRHLILFSLFILCTPALRSQDLYLKYDPMYFDKLDYRFTENPSDIMYSTYKLHKNTSEKLFFETGTENSNSVVRKTVPGALQNSYDVNLDQNDVAAINNGGKKAYIVKPVTGGYLVLPVSNASFMYYSDSLMAYEGTDYALQADFKAPLPANLATAQSASEVSYLGDEQIYGRQAYDFNRSPIGQSSTSKQNSTLTILPAIGLMNEKVGENSNFRVTYINGMSVETYLQKMGVPIVQSSGVVVSQGTSLPSTYSTVTTQNGENTTVYPIINSSVQGDPATYNTITTRIEEGSAYEPVASDMQGVPAVYSTVTHQWEAVPSDYTIGGNKIIAQSNIPSTYSTQSQAVPSTYSPVTTPNEAPAVIYNRVPSPAVELPSTYSTVSAQPDVVTPIETVSTESPYISTDVEGQHTVQNGESLYGLSRKYNVTIAQLRQWNNIPEGSSAINLNMKLFVADPNPVVDETAMDLASKSNELPQAYSTTESAPTTPCRLSSKDGEHIVQPGETMSSIGRLYGVSIASLRQWNDFQLTNDAIFPCQRLLISNPNFETTLVSKGSVEKTLPRAITIPANHRPTYKHVNKAPTIAPVQRSSNSTGLIAKGVSENTKALYVKKGVDLHVVKHGESVSSLAKDYGLSEAEFRTINKLSKGESLRSGQVVHTKDCACNAPDVASLESTRSIPKTYSYTYAKPGSTLSAKGVSKKPTNKYHVVQEDETLQTISERYGIPVEKLRKLNNLDREEGVLPNQLLVIEE